MTALTNRILELEQQLLQAQLHHEVPVLERLLHEDLIFIGPAGQTMGREDDLKAHEQGLLQLEQLSCTDTQISFQGPQTAVVRAIVQLAGQYEAQVFSGTYTYLRIWQQQYDGHWQIIAGSCTPLQGA